MATQLHLGDTVSGHYHDVAFTGLLHSYDGSGYLYVTFPAPLVEPVVFGMARARIALHPGGDDIQALRLVSRPETQPEVRGHSYAVLGGASLA